MMEQRPKLLGKVREAIRLKHYSKKTEESYIYWIRKFLRFHRLRHPREMGSKEMEAFLTHLAIEEHVAASTQNQALSALLFLYRDVLQIDLRTTPDTLRAQKPRHVPTVLTID